MDLIEESEVNNFKVKYYSGFDIEKILKHPKDGSGGMMMVFFNSVKEEETKHKRNQKIIKLLESRNVDNFQNLLDSLNNMYLALYQTHGYTDIVYKSIKFKLEVIRDYDFKVTNVIWKPEYISYV